MTLGMEKLVEVTAGVELGALLANRELAPVISELKENIRYFISKLGKGTGSIFHTSFLVVRRGCCQCWIAYRSTSGEAFRPRC